MERQRIPETKAEVFLYKREFFKLKQKGDKQQHDKKRKN